MASSRIRNEVTWAFAALTVMLVALVGVVPPAHALPSAQIHTVGPCIPQEPGVSRAELAVWRIVCETRHRLVRALAMSVVTAPEDQRPAEVQWFWAEGYPWARERSQQQAAQDLDFLDRVRAIYHKEQYPRVSTAAEGLGENTPDALRDFVATGFDAALALDAAAASHDGSAREALTQADRDYVQKLSMHALGASVRAAAAAASALRPEQPVQARDDAIVQFFASGWMSSATADAFIAHQHATDTDLALQGHVATLTQAAHEAQHRFESSPPGAQREHALTDSRRMWGQLLTVGREGAAWWLSEERTSLNHAEAWLGAHLSAQQRSGPHWKPLILPCAQLAQRWRDHAAFSRIARADYDAVIALATQHLSALPSAPRQVSR